MPMQDRIAANQPVESRSTAEYLMKLGEIDQKFSHIFKIFLKHFAQNGLAARKQNSKPLQLPVLESLILSISEEELMEFYSTAERMVNNRYALTIIAKILNDVHKKYGVRQMGWVEAKEILTATILGMKYYDGLPHK